MNESDLRVQRTRRLLREAFIELVITRGYEAVAVTDITRQAQVGHKTFYRHYRDKEDLVYTIMGDILQEAQTVLLAPHADDFAAEQNTIHAVRFAAQYADLLRALLQSPAAEKLIQPLIGFGMAEGRRFFAKGNTPEELVAYHFVTSMMSLVRWWLEQGMAYSAEEMAEFINRLLIRPLKALA
ncbi:MAG: TetR/AcrR family transcriptional regulator [Chloroflexi bacterium]|nr:TetR/AcrR family transcriptional regulator [Chloroflexota bacterium]